MRWPLHKAAILLQHFHCGQSGPCCPAFCLMQQPLHKAATLFEHFCCGYSGPGLLLLLEALFDSSILQSAIMLLRHLPDAVPAQCRLLQPELQLDESTLQGTRPLLRHLPHLQPGPCRSLLPRSELNLSTPVGAIMFFKQLSGSWLSASPGSLISDVTSSLRISSLYPIDWVAGLLSGLVCWQPS